MNRKNRHGAGKRWLALALAFLMSASVLSGDLTAAAQEAAVDDLAQVEMAAEPAGETEVEASGDATAEESGEMSADTSAEADAEIGDGTLAETDENNDSAPADTAGETSGSAAVQPDGETSESVPAEAGGTTSDSTLAEPAGGDGEAGGDVTTEPDGEPNDSAATEPNGEAKDGTPANPSGEAGDSAGTEPDVSGNETLPPEQPDVSGNETLSSEQPDVSGNEIEAETGKLSVSRAELVWLDGTETTQIDGDRLSMAPGATRKGADKAEVIAQLKFSMGGIENAAPGEIEIRIPAHIFKNRAGENADSVYLPLPQESFTEGEKGFHYRTEDDEIVITNYREIAGTYTLSLEFSYTFQPRAVANGYVGALQASFKVKRGNESAEAKSARLEAALETHVPDVELNKFFNKKYEKWQESWGTAPDDAEDYFYVRWTLGRIEKDSGQWTQPFELFFKEQPDSQGEVIGWHASSADGRPADQVIRGTAEDFAKYVFYSNIDNPREWSNGFENINGQSYVILRYPREMLKDTKMITNKATAVLVGADGERREVTGSGAYTYQAPNYDYAGDRLWYQKSSRGGGFTGVIPLLKNGNNATLRYYLKADSQGYGMTENGTRPYMTYVEDTMVYLDRNQRLLPGDYSFSAFAMSEFREYERRDNPDIGYEEVLSENYADYQPIEVYVQTTARREWSKAGEIRRTGQETYQWNGTDGAVKELAEGAAAPLPEGTCEVRFCHTGKPYRLLYEVQLSMTLHPTEHLLTLLGDREEAEITNIGTFYLADDGGTIHRPSGGDTVSGVVDLLKETVRQDDLARYGKVVDHGSASDKLENLRKSSTMRKIDSLYQTDTAKGMESLQYTLFQREKISFDSEEALKLAEQHGLLREQREGVFYDLLPFGTTVDLASVKAFLEARKGYKDLAAAVTTEVKENWRNSGRTMMIFHVTAPQGTKNYYKGEEAGNRQWKYLSTGFSVQYRLNNTWENIKDNGAKVLNSAAYYSLSGELAEGRADDGGTIADSAWFKDLDGNPAGEQKNVVYAEVVSTFSPLSAAELGFRKSVKAAGEERYGQQAVVPMTGEYSYQLRFANGDKAKASNVVIFDILEEAHGGQKRWKGALESVDVSQPRAKGIDAEVYYSTSHDWGKLTENSPYVDLMDTSRWSKTPPAEMADVTAVAVDLRRGTDGKEYVFGPQEVALCHLYMRAPADGSYADDPQALQDESVYAYNKAHIMATLHPLTGGQSLTDIETTAAVKTAVREPELTLHKESAPQSGTKEQPTPVKAGETLTYELETANMEKTQTMRQVVLEDVIPDGLRVDADKISAYFGTDKNNAKPVADVSRVKLTVQGQKLLFTVDKLTPGESVHFTIPATVEGYGARFENTARITEINGQKWEKPSETTYHESKNGEAALTVVKQWQDGNNADGKRPQSVTVRLYADSKETGESATLTDADGWTHIFTGLPKYQTGTQTEITYTVQEEAVEGYEVSVGVPEKQESGNADGAARMSGSGSAAGAARMSGGGNANDAMRVQESESAESAARQQDGSLDGAEAAHWKIVLTNTKKQEPTEPEKPVEPDKPTEPEKPVEPDKPTEPEKPAEPDKPTEPEKPVDPDKPTEPEKPVEPEKPTEPEKPGEPEKPSQPQQPSQPNQPDRPTPPAPNGTVVNTPPAPEIPAVQPQVSEPPAQPAAAPAENPDHGAMTGDEKRTGAWFIALGAAAAGLAGAGAVWGRRRRREDGEKK